MGDELVSSYLRSKLSSTLDEAEADTSSPSAIISRIRSIENSYSLIPLPQLHDLLDVLSECCIFAYQRHQEAASKKGFSFFRRLWFQKKIRSRLDDIETKLKDKTTSPPPSTSGGLVYSPIALDTSDPPLIQGFESYVMEIEKLLVPSNSSDTAAAEGFTAIGIVGRCGCGKTALAQEVFASRIIQKEFSPRIWVSLSDLLFDNKRVDPRVRVLNYILGEINHNNVSVYENSVVKLLEMLQRGLMGKRYLIVLDDAWRMDEWFADLMGSTTAESLTHGLPKGGGGAVIATGREENVIRRMVGDKHLICPQLSDEICWNIFTGALPHQLELSQIKDEVIKICDGLPLAARSLAKIIPELLPKNQVQE